VAEESFPVAGELPRQVRIVDVGLSALLFLAQAALGFAALVSFGAIPMSTDQCAYQACGDEKFIDWAMMIIVGSGALGAVFFGVGVLQLVRRKVAFWAPLSGCAGQVGFLILAWAVAKHAGPTL
jgi:hypothetical protein